MPERKMAGNREATTKSGAPLNDGSTDRRRMTANRMTAGERLLTPRQLNRATLARQLLLDRTVREPFSVLRGLVAMQGQVSNAPYIGLWARIRNFDPTALTRMIQNRQVVRAPFVRGTLHLLSASDYLLMQPLLRSALSANLRLFAVRTTDFDEEGALLAIASYLRERPRTGEELRARMEEFVPGFGRLQLLDSLRMRMGLLQLPPAGTWGFTGKPEYAEASAWLRKPFARMDEGRNELILRYLRAFGPASVQDLQAWSGLSKMGESVDRVRDKLIRFRDERGRELFDLPDAPRPSADTPAPVRFLPEYDNLLFAYADRHRIVSEELRPKLLERGFNGAAVLVDGFASGRWKLFRRSDRNLLVVELFEAISRAAKKEIVIEGERLLQMTTGGNGSFEIEIAVRGPV